MLFATVFSVGSFSRHSEITAAKASGISFHRLVLPVFALALLASVLTFFLGEAAPFGVVPQGRELEDRFPEGLARNGSGGEAGAANNRSSLDHGGSAAQLGRLNGGPLAGGARPNAKKVEVIVGRHGEQVSTLTGET